MARLEPLPPAFAATREALHRVAERVVAPARKPHNEIALMATPGGFGTPAFDYDGRRMKVRVDGAELVVEKDDTETRSPLSTIADAAAMVGEELYPDGPPADDDDLGIDQASARLLAEFYALAAAALASFEQGLGPEDDPSATNLWPEHFDVALEAGAEAAGSRANYGGSPGDDDHPEPYLYVGPWTAEVRGALWNAAGFNGAELAYAELVAAEDPAAAALEFFEARHRALADN